MPEQTELIETEKPASLEDTLREAYEELETDEPAQLETDAAVSGGQGEGEADAEPSPRSQAARTRVRGPDGKFVKADAEAPTGPDTFETAPEGQEAATEQPVAGETPEYPPGATPRRLDPPQRWPVPDKEAFNALPDVAKTQVLDFWGSMERKFTQGSQDLARYRDRYNQLDQVINHYVPQWNLKGMTDAQAVAELCAAQDLIMRDPYQGLSLLIDKTGITLEQLYQYRQQGGQAAPATQQPQQVIDPRIDEVYSWLQQSQQTQQQQIIDAGVADINSVRNQTGQDGRYVYPELWNDSYLVERVQPLVHSIRQTHPGLTLGEAVKRSVHTLRMLDGKPNGSLSPNGSKLTSEAEIANIRRASTSVRGRGNAATPSTTKGDSGEKVADSLEAVWEQLSSS